MALFTGKGDDGTTKAFDCDQRMSKSSAVAEALGALDEANSYLGMCKIQSRNDECMLSEQHVAELVHELQDDMFIIQAEVAGAQKTITREKVVRLESIITQIEHALPEIRSFFIAGGVELSSRFDFARTLVRRAERRVVAVHEEKIQTVGEHTLAYLNRLSSVLYALARLVNHQRNITEDAPDYR